MSPEEDIRALERRIHREKQARAIAEAEVEERTRELYLANRQLRRLMAQLEEGKADLKLARDKALDTSAARVGFLANISHELRTPLSAILGYNELLQEELEDQAVEVPIGITARIQSAGQHLLQLVDEVLELANLESGKVAISPRAMPILGFFKIFQGRCAPLFERHGNTFQLTLHPDLPVQFTQDTRHLDYLLMALLSNAVKATHQGLIELIVTAPVEHMVCFDVIDSGPGIPRQDLEKIFDAFSKLDPSKPRRMGSTGLGLPIARELTRQMGGELTAVSSPGRGSTFTLMLPVHARARRANEATGNFLSM